jgi:hypothetical protein
MSDPTPLYRFLDSDAALKTLVAGKFRVGLVSKFNDQFEWKLGFTGAATQGERTFADTFAAEHLRWLETWMGILCFSKTACDPILWSLYADKHSGVAFEVKHPWKDNEIVEIKYPPERPVVDFNRLRGIHDKNEKEKYLLSLLDALMRLKSPSWSFEREWRLHIDLNNREFCPLFDGRHHWQIPRISLKRVILGFCCPLEEASVRKLLDMNGFTDTVIARAKLSHDDYSVEVNPLENRQDETS